MPSARNSKAIQRAIEEAQQRNALYAQRGELRLARQVHFRDAVQSKEWPRLDGFRNISVSAGAKKWRALSANALGPVGQAPSVEIAWRFSALHEGDVHLGRPTVAWHARWAQGIALERGKPIPRKLRKNIAHDTRFWWQGRILTLVEARKRILCAEYVRLARQQPEYAELRELLHRGYNIQLLGYDAAPTESVDALAVRINDPAEIFGYEHALMAMLLDADAVLQ